MRSYSVALLVLGRLAMPSALVRVGGGAVLALHHVGHAPGALKAGGSEVGGDHTSYLSRTPRIYSCKIFLASVNFFRFNAKNWHFRHILREKVAFFYRLNAKNWRFSV